MPFGVEDADRNAYYEGFDNIFSQVPHFKRYQFWLLGFAGWTCVIGGQTQTASIILQAFGMDILYLEIFLRYQEFWSSIET